MNGKFDVQGHSQVQVSRTGKTPLTVNLDMDLTSADKGVQGTVSDGSWTASLLGDRAVFDAQSNPALQAGNYTMVMTGGSDPATSPIGESVGVVTVGRDGLLKLTGTLADGTPIHQTVSLSRNGSWPLYSSLYSGKGSLISWVTFSNQVSSSFSGAVSWIKTAAAGGKFYQAGFSNEVSAIGSRYLPSADPQVPTNSVVILSGGNLTDPITNNVALKIDDATGKVSGTFINPQTQLATPIKAVILQQQNTVQGYFLGTNQTGRAFSTPE